MEEDKLEMLDYESISNSKSYAKITESAEFVELSSEEALINILVVDVSVDVYMKLNTSFASVKQWGYRDSR